MNQTKPKPSKSKLALREPAKPLAEPPARPLDADHPAMRIFSEALAPSNPEPPPNITPPPQIEAPSKSSGQPLQIEAAPDIEAPPKSERAQGFLRVTNELIDDILPTLRPSEQVVLLRLYRLTRGFNKARCTVSVGTLASRCHLKPSQTRSCLKELERRKHIKRIGVDLANPVQDLRGITFEVLVEGVDPSKSGGASNITAPSKSEPNKVNTQKENTQTQVGAGGSRFSIEDCRNYARHLQSTGQGITNPGGYATTIHRTGEADALIEAFLSPAPAAVDASDCPDCQGSGYFYPEGVEKGVKKCSHERLK